MIRARLRNKFLKDRSKENKSRYSKQRNYCASLIRKKKKDYYSNLDIKKVTDNKIVSTERITSTDNGKVVVTEQDTANVLNTFFSNIVTNLKIPEYADYDPIVNNISDPILKVILRYKNNPSILTIEEVCKKSHKFSFSFSQVGKKDMLEEIQRLDIKKRLRNQIFPSELLKKTQTYSVSTYYLLIIMQ